MLSTRLSCLRVEQRGVEALAVSRHTNGQVTQALCFSPALLLKLFLFTCLSKMLKVKPWPLELSERAVLGAGICGASVPAGLLVALPGAP